MIFLIFKIRTASVFLHLRFQQCFFFNDNRICIFCLFVSKFKKKRRKKSNSPCAEINRCLVIVLVYFFLFLFFSFFLLFCYQRWWILGWAHWRGSFCFIVHLCVGGKNGKWINCLFKKNIYTRLVCKHAPGFFLSSFVSIKTVLGGWTNPSIVSRAFFVILKFILDWYSWRLFTTIRILMWCGLRGVEYFTLWKTKLNFNIKTEFKKKYLSKTN